MSSVPPVTEDNEWSLKNGDTIKRHMELQAEMLTWSGRKKFVRKNRDLFLTCTADISLSSYPSYRDSVVGVVPSESPGFDSRHVTSPKRSDHPDPSSMGTGSSFTGSTAAEALR